MHVDLERGVHLGERTGVTPLDLEIDAGMDVFKMVAVNECRRYAWRCEQLPEEVRHRRSLNTRETSCCIQWADGPARVVEDQGYMRG